MPSFQIDFGYCVKNRNMNVLRTVIEGWGKAVERDAKYLPRDPAYWYGERPNLSVLAAGAWLSGAVALQEFDGSKGWGKNKYDGRYDLFVGLKSCEIYIEGKRKFLRAHYSPKQRAKVVADSIDSVITDARQVYVTKARSVGCVFFVPWFSKRAFPSFKKDAVELIRQQVQSFIDLDSADMWAWCFPKVTRHLPDKSYYPGVFLGICDVNRR
jgi:hypothetical protein